MTPLSYGGAPSYYFLIVPREGNIGGRQSRFTERVISHFCVLHGQISCLGMFATFILKMGQSRPLFHLFLSFQTHITNFATYNYVKNCPFSIWCWDSNSRPLERESPPVTTRPGLQPICLLHLLKLI